MLKKDYYEILQVDKNADADTIKKMYRKLAMKYHPDRNAGDKSAEVKFKEIGEAYSILSDPVKRSSYDKFGHSGVNQDASSSAYEGAYSTFGDIFGDIFGDVFGSQDKSDVKDNRFKKVGEDITKEILINLEDVINGLDTKIIVESYKKCSVCNGYGTSDGKDLDECKQCSGTGKQRVQQGFFLFQKQCFMCNGVGYVIKGLCLNCEKGRVFVKKILNVKIPQGVDTGDTIRLLGEGNVGCFGGCFGNLYLSVSVRKHDIFQRDGLNLFCEVPVDYITLVLGGVLVVLTIYGSVKLKIPESTQSHTVFKIKSKGLRSAKSNLLGDLFCKVVLEVPVCLTLQQKNLLIDFHNLLNKSIEKHMPEQENWKKKVSRFLT